MKKIFKKIYQILPLMGFMKLWRRTKTPKFYKYLTVKGSFSVELPNGNHIQLRAQHDLYIEKEIFWNGIYSEFEPETLKTWMQLCESADVVFDIGANTGIFSMLAHGCRVNSIHAFEPIEYNYKVLEKNILLNQAEEVRLNKIALSNEIGEDKMFVKEGEINYINSLEENRYLNEGETEINIQKTTLKEYIENNNLQKIDLIKLDVEGHEFKVLEGAGDYLQKFKPSIVIEVLNSSFGASLIPYVENIHDYLYYRIDDTLGKLIPVRDFTTHERTNFLITTKKYD